MQNPSVFLVRTICHDWPDELVVKILCNLRSAAGGSTRLIVGDYVIPYACPSDNLEVTSNSSNAPPLLGNLGKAGFNAYYIDMTVSYANVVGVLYPASDFDIKMEVLLNGQERTLPHQIALAEKAGWKVTQVNNIRNSHFGYLVAEPVFV